MAPIAARWRSIHDNAPDDGEMVWVYGPGSSEPILGIYHSDERGTYFEAVVGERLACATGAYWTKLVRPAAPTDVYWEKPKVESEGVMNWSDRIAARLTQIEQILNLRGK